MTRKIFRGVFALLSFILFILIIKYFYFDTKIGFNTETIKLNHSTLPMWVDAIIFTTIMPLLLFATLDEIYNKIYSYYGKWFITHYFLDFSLKSLIFLYNIVII